jgi:hypothetical protein
MPRSWKKGGQGHGKRGIEAIRQAMKSSSDMKKK